jgi:hypothetical protein
MSQIFIVIYNFLYFGIVFFTLYNIFFVMRHRHPTESYIVIKTKGDLGLFIFNLFLSFCYLSLLIAKGNESPFLNLPYLIFTHLIPFLIVIDIFVYRFTCTYYANEIPTCKQILTVLGFLLLFTGIQILCFYVYPLSLLLYQIRNF